MASVEAQASGSGQREPNHGMRIFVLSVVLAVIFDSLFWFLLSPHMPPGTMTSSAASEQFDINVLAAIAIPVMIFIFVYFGYALIMWRRRPGDETDGPALHGNARIQTTWITVTSVIVLFLAGFGTYELIVPQGAGAGEGPAPIWTPPGAKLTVAQQTAPWKPGQVLVIQVIGQQWKFGYRYPQFGGFETSALVIPNHTWVQFNVTSIDVIHSFWAYQLGVKADANPGVNNVAFTDTGQLGRITVRCDELCGLWHGAMYDYGKVVPVSQFQSWANSSRVELASITKLLPPYATTYNPTVIPLFRLSPVMKKLGVFGAGGGYYPPQDPQQP
jgi:cytochrome c oxidase subunit 2